MSYLNKEYRGIITKAICGKGRKYKKEDHIISPAQRPSSILGCWVINHSYRAKKKSKNTVEINGSYDINIWYSYDDNTKTDVVTERITYCDHIELSTRDKHCINDNYDVIAKVIQQPNCLECSIEKKGHKVKVEVEREMMVEVIGETKVYVKVDPHAHHHDDDGDDWESKEVSDEELKHVNPNFFGKRD